ncbi:hypothetical protein [Sphingomonas jatrophae]|uniref:Uncharacterized protein n=1 Tax=Sphingomonas jatrophae TaxID=1166337 RepID=A0A1I6L0K9_9SPHN|nr:hypothetical protein [Sphingomonas jatrophae]SFR96986.1 hypothetical protein SAMN05192580_2104 [Sphingomonas jatrophae]
MIALALAATALAAPLASHDVVLTHGATPVRASYQAHADMRMKTIGMSAGTRMSTERCRWIATVRVERQLAPAHGNHHPLSRTLAGARKIEGSRPGHCMTARAGVQRDLAARTGDLHDHVRAVAAADQPTLLAELKTVRALALD